MEIGPNQPLSASVTDALLAAAEDEQIILARNCWACGWAEERSVVIDSIETVEGEADTIERATLVDEITDELAAIDDVEILEETLATIRGKQRTDSATTDTNTDTPE